MSLKKTFLLLLVLAGVASYIYFVEFPQEEKKKASESFIGSAIPQEIMSISISKGGDLISLENSSPQKELSSSERKALKETPDPVLPDSFSSWKIKGMEEVPVDTASLATYVNTARGISFGASLPKDELGSDLKPFGLDAPSLTVSFKTKNAERKILLGKENEFLSKRYVQVADTGDIFLVPTFQLTSLDKTKDDFRRKKLLQLSEPSIERMTLHRGADVVELQQQGEQASWKITKPIEAVAGRTPIGSLIRELNELSANDLVEFGKEVHEEKYGLTNPDVWVEIKEKDKDPYQVKLARKNRSAPVPDSGDEEVYVRVSSIGIIGETKPNPMFRIAPALADLREKKQFSINPLLVSKVTISESGKPDVVLEKKENEWWVGDKKGDSVFIGEYIQQLSRTEAKSFLPPQTLNPVLTVTVIMTNGESKVLKIGQTVPSGGNLAEGLEQFVIDSKAYTNLIPKVETLLPVASSTPESH